MVQISGIIHEFNSISIVLIFLKGMGSRKLWICDFQVHSSDRLQLLGWKAMENCDTFQFKQKISSLNGLFLFSLKFQLFLK